MASLSRFLEERLALKSTSPEVLVDRPWKRIFLGYSMTFHHKPRLKVAAARVKRFKAGLRKVCRRGRGRRIAKVIEEIAPKLRGWASYFRLAEVKGIFEDLDQWLRRKLRWICGDSGSAPIPGPGGRCSGDSTEARAWNWPRTGEAPGGVPGPRT